MRYALAPSGCTRQPFALVDTFTQGEVGRYAHETSAKRRARELNARAEAVAKATRAACAAYAGLSTPAPRLLAVC